MNKTFIQSRAQSVFHRLYQCVTQLFWVVVPVLLIVTFTGESVDTLDFTIYSIFGIAVLFTLWLLIFNSGKSKVIEHGLELNETGVSYINYGSKYFIAWDNFSGFKIKNWFPRMIVLQSSNSKEIEFCYYAFSSDQRREIFDSLRSK